MGRAIVSHASSLAYQHPYQVGSKRTLQRQLSHGGLEHGLWRDKIGFQF